MNKVVTFTAIMALASTVMSQSITTTIDDITLRWDEEAALLSTYDGLRYFCANEEYRFSTIQVLRDIHHYDSVLYEKLVDAQRQGKSNHEVAKTLKEIEEFEKEYTTKAFIDFLYNDCQASKSLERRADDLRKDSGEGSYDNQTYVLEVELGRYVHHITKRVDQIRQHVHHIYN